MRELSKNSMVDLFQYLADDGSAEIVLQNLDGFSDKDCSAVQPAVSFLFIAEYHVQRAA